MLFVLFIPFLGTALGSAMVFFLKSSMPPRLEKFLLGFAAGVMTAASIWSLLIPSLEMNAGENIVWLKSALGFLSGMFFLLLLDSVIPHLHLHSDTPEGRRSSRVSRTAMLVFAVTLHNLPEGMSVGAAYSGASLSSIALALGIAIQNFPEGAIISMPLAAEGRAGERPSSTAFYPALWNPSAPSSRLYLHQHSNLFSPRFLPSLQER